MLMLANIVHCSWWLTLMLMLANLFHCSWLLTLVVMLANLDGDVGLPLWLCWLTLMVLLLANLMAVVVKERAACLAAEPKLANIMSVNYQTGC